MTSDRPSTGRGTTSSILPRRIVGRATTDPDAGDLGWPTVRIATWNVNSIRSRIDRVAAWLERNEVDAIAIQETKAREDQFPFDRFQALGYEVAHHGFNQWNGV